MLDIKQIMGTLPHRYPFLLIDRVIKVIPGKSVLAKKNVTINEEYFKGHFENDPVMPGVLQIEAMAQAAGIALLKVEQFQGSLVYLAGVNASRFKRPVYPGDTLMIAAEIVKQKKSIAKCAAKITVDGELVSSAEIMLAISGADAANVKIDPTACVHSSANLAPGVKVGPYAVINEDAKIGENSVIDAHVVIGAGSELGPDCHIHYGAVIGDLPQDIKYTGEKTNVVMGARNRIREYVTINRATGPGNKTILGDDNILMSHVHIGHNCILGNNIVIVSLSQLAGHITVEDNVIIGGMVGIPQFLRLGKMAMIGGYARLFQDIPPFMLAEGNPADVQAINAVGLKRNGMSRASISAIKEAYKLIYRTELNISQALSQINKNCQVEGALPEEIKYLIKFIKNSTKGINRKKTSTELLSSENSGLAETDGFYTKVKNMLTEKNRRKK